MIPFVSDSDRVFGVGDYLLVPTLRVGTHVRTLCVPSLASRVSHRGAARRAFPRRSVGTRRTRRRERRCLTRIGCSELVIISSFPRSASFLSLTTPRSLYPSAVPD